MAEAAHSEGGAPNPPPEPVLEVPPPKEIKILETAEDIHVRPFLLVPSTGL